jgi:hypothetical protein
MIHESGGFSPGPFGRGRQSPLLLLRHRAKARSTLLKGTASAVPKKRATKWPSALPKAGAKPKGKATNIALLSTGSKVVGGSHPNEPTFCCQKIPEEPNPTSHSQMVSGSLQSLED